MLGHCLSSRECEGFVEFRLDSHNKGRVTEKSAPSMVPFDT